MIGHNGHNNIYSMQLLIDQGFSQGGLKESNLEKNLGLKLLYFFMKQNPYNICKKSEDFV